MAYAEILPTETPADCVRFLRRATSWYADHDVTIQRALSDNGNGYRSHAWRDACAELAIQRRYTRPRRPRQTAVRITGAPSGAVARLTPVLLERDSTKRLAHLDAFALSCPLEWLGAGLAPARWPDQKPVRPWA